MHISKIDSVNFNGPGSRFSSRVARDSVRKSKEAISTFQGMAEAAGIKPAVSKHNWNRWSK